MGEKHREERIEEILNAATEVFLEKGYSNTTMEDIINATTLSKGGFYYYFKSTKEIFFRILDRRTNIEIMVDIDKENIDKKTKEEIIDEDGNDIELDHFDIEFKDVTFAYEKEDVLHDISFKVPERSMTALVGKSGCGKTTIANLIARFWDVQKGK